MTAFLDLFSGIGGFALAAYWAGLRFDKHYFSEIEPYAVELYKKRFPEAEFLGDINNVNYSKMPKGEYLATGGFPCQPFSYIGLEKGEDDKRNLWTECKRMLRELQPRIALFENVRGILTSPGRERKGEFFNRLLSDIYQCGYDAEWQVISARETGAPHLRRRVWIVAYPSKLRYKANTHQKNRNLRKCNKEKQKEWEQLYSIATRDNKIYNWEDHEQILTGTYDGLPEELDAIKGAGNAIVPQCAEMILKLPVFDYWRVNE